MSDDWNIWLPSAIAVVGVTVVYWLLSAWMRAIARSEISRALKGYIAGHVLRPRNTKGQFRGK